MNLSRHCLDLPPTTLQGFRDTFRQNTPSLITSSSLGHGLDDLLSSRGENEAMEVAQRMVSSFLRPRREKREIDRGQFVAQIIAAASTGAMNCSSTSTSLSWVNGIRVPHPAALTLSSVPINCLRATAKILRRIFTNNTPAKYITQVPYLHNPPISHPDQYISPTLPTFL